MITFFPFRRFPFRRLEDFVFLSLLFILNLNVCLNLNACASPPAISETDAAALPDSPGVQIDPEDPPERPAFDENLKDLPVSAFREIWAYVVSGREEALSARYPLSDIGYFGAEINSYGELADVPNRKKIAFFTGRVHLVVACQGRALTHFILEPGSRVRNRLIADLLAASANYDGLQIDFEEIPARDGDNFLSFLAELRAGLGGKVFSVALRARTRSLENDVYDYRRISPLVDRILVMAYDEHWSGSEPGPIASMDWCRAVAAHALATVGAEKLIMGLPFYGRAWGSINPSRAFIFSGIERLRTENRVTETGRENGIPTFSYEVPVAVTVYYEDEYSLSARLEMYRSMGVKSAGFWRLGQETPAVWNLLELQEEF
jgi:hypothetical protein